MSLVAQAEGIRGFCLLLIGWAGRSVSHNVWLDFGFCWASDPAPLLHDEWFDKAIKQVSGSFSKEARVSDATLVWTLVQRSLALHSLVSPHT